MNTLPLPQTPCQIRDHQTYVVSNQAYGPGLFLLTLQTKAPVEAAHFACKPGQFVMLDLPTTNWHFRRPFSVFDFNPNGEIQLFYKVVGYGTETMAALKPGDAITLLGPLGNGAFPSPKPDERILLIGGGIGIAPLHLYAKRLYAKSTPQNDLTCLFGIRRTEEAAIQEHLTPYFESGKFILTTQGPCSTAFTGTVLDYLKTVPETLKNIDSILICGPTRMMQAVCHWLTQASSVSQPVISENCKIWVSLEEHMPCGLGACSGCVVEMACTQALPQKVCLSGPVFNARDLEGYCTPLNTVPENKHLVMPCPH